MERFELGGQDAQLDTNPRKKIKVADVDPELSKVAQFLGDVLQIPDIDLDSSDGFQTQFL